MLAVPLLLLAVAPLPLTDCWQLRAVSSSTSTRVTLPESAADRAALDGAADVEFSCAIAVTTTWAEPALALPYTVGDVEVFIDDVRIGEKREALPSSLPVPAALLADGHAVVRLVVHQHPWYARTVHHVPIVDAGPLAFDDARAAAAAAEAARLRRHADVELPQLFFAIALLIASLYHALLWWLRRSLRAYALYAAFLALFAAWSWIVGSASTSIWPAVSAQDLWRWAPGLGALAAGSLFIDFAFLFFRDTAPSRRFRAGQAFVVVTSLLCLVPGSVGFIAAASPVRIVPFLIVMLAMLGLIAKDAWKGSADARTVVAGFAILFVLALRMLAGVQGLMAPSTYRLDLVGFGCFVGAMAVALARRYARTLDELDSTNTAIARFVPFKFLSLLQRESVRQVMKGDNVKLNMSVMFCDIRGFTTLAETAGADATFRQINRYLSVMEPEIHREGGYINQYMGDGIMSLFHTSTDHVLRAALGMVKSLYLLNQEREKIGEPPLKIGVGINTGPLMLGTIGGGEQLDSGVIGDAVNLASRVEGMTKMYGVTVLVGEQTVAALPDRSAFHLRELDRVVAKGKREPITIYELLDVDDAASTTALLPRWNEALRAYRAGEFDVAAAAFEEFVDDGPARLLAERCRAFIAAPPKHWTGVLELVSK